jgi:hypothetical protein
MSHVPAGARICHGLADAYPEESTVKLAVADVLRFLVLAARPGCQDARSSGDPGRGTEEDKLMRKQVGLQSIVGFFGLLAAANAQPPSSSAAGASFDGTYRLISSTKVNDMYTSYNGQMGRCPDRKPGPVHIMGGRAHYTTATGYRLEGTVGSQGELTMRSEMVGSSRPARLQASGIVDGSGTVHVRQRASACSYDFVWQKQSK